MLTAGPLLHWVSNICLVSAGLGCFYLMIAGALTFRFRVREQKSTLTAKPVTVPVTILVPLCGSEPGLHHRLMLLCQQDYEGPVQIVCGTLDMADPAIDIVRQLAAMHLRHSIECHIDPRVHGLNLKISNLMNMTQHVRHSTLILIDSDIEVDSDHVAKMIAELQRPRIGAATCLYQGVAAEGIWAHLAAMRINTDFLPSVIVGMALSLTHPCFGASIAISRKTLRRIGGFKAFVDYFWDDYAIGEAVREIGYEVAVAPFAARHICATNTARDWLADEYRAALTIRGIDPLGHAGSVITHPLPLALISMLLGGGSPAAALALIALACRIAVWRSTKHRFHAHSGTILLLTARDLLSLGLYVASFFGAAVTWRGRRYRLFLTGRPLPTQE